MTCCLPLLTTALAVLALAGCGDGKAASERAPTSVVATTTQLADLARNVAGDSASVRGLLTPNADPHDYEVRPSDIEGLSDARLVLQSGGDLDEWLYEAVQSAGGSPTVVKLSQRLGATRRADDPHWWQDPRNAMTAVRAIRDALADADPPNAAKYRSNAGRYLAALKTLDASVAACIEKVPAGSRKLVTTHDALGYYADRYGIKVVGAVIPSLSTQGQPSAGETAELVKTIKREKVRAIFAESSVNPKVEKAISRESGASIGEALYADTLGPKGSSGDTYVKSVQANTTALVEGFTQGAETCRFG